jgi:hypothetical protein
VIEKMIELAVIERKEDEVRAGGCCEPDCGPETCAPASPAETEEREAQARAQAGCCEPECGPETCSC